jgi:hypothetical protein
MNYKRYGGKRSLPDEKPGDSTNKNFISGGRARRCGIGGTRASE